MIFIYLLYCYLFKQPTSISIACHLVTHVCVLFVIVGVGILLKENRSRSLIMLYEITARLISKFSKSSEKQQSFFMARLWKNARVLFTDESLQRVRRQ